MIGDTNHVTHMMTECYNSNKYLQISLFNKYYVSTFYVCSTKLYAEKDKKKKSFLFSTSVFQQAHVT